MIDVKLIRTHFLFIDLSIVTVALMYLFPCNRIITLYVASQCSKSSNAKSSLLEPTFFESREGCRPLTYPALCATRGRFRGEEKREKEEERRKWSVMGIASKKMEVENHEEK